MNDSTSVDYKILFSKNYQQSDNLRQQFDFLAKKKGWNYVPVVPMQTLQERILACDKHVLIDQIKDPILAFAFWNQLNSKLQNKNLGLTVITDNLVNFEPLSHIDFIFHPSLLGHKIIHADPWHFIHLTQNQPTRLFNCFIRRADSVRQSWLYKLHENDLLDQGYVSFLMFQLDNYSSKTDIDLFDHIHYSNGMDKLENFHRCYLELRHKMPYRNFQENQFLWDKILDSKYSVVLDTAGSLDNENFWFMSEKIVRALTYPTLQLMFVQRGMIKKLTDLGFAVNPQQNYDNLEWVERFDAILATLKQDTDYNFVELKHQALHNIDVMNKLLFTLDNLFELVLDSK